MALLDQNLDSYVQLKLEESKLQSNNPVFPETLKLVKKELERLKAVIMGGSPPSLLSW